MDFFSKMKVAQPARTQYYLNAKNNSLPEARLKDRGLDIFDYSPLTIVQKNNYWEVESWNQEFFYAANPATVISDGDATYYFRPKYQADKNSRLMDFDLKFPDFSIPKGKTTIVQPSPLREKTGHKYVTKGVTYSRDGKPGEKFFFLGDEWLTRIGCPAAYNSSQQDFDEWIRNTPAKRILDSFKEVVGQFTGYGYLMLNWEAVANRANGADREKLLACFRWYQQQNFNAELSAWNEAAVKISRISLEYDSAPAQYMGAIDFPGTFGELMNKYPKLQRKSTDYAGFLDILHVGGYINYPSNYSTIQHYMMEYMLNKRYFPNKKVLATIWANQEIVGDFPLGTRNFGDKYCYIKPATFPQTMFNWGVWSVAVGDGFDLWNDSVYLTDNPKDTPYACHRAGSDQMLPYGENWYPTNPMKNVDDLMAGTWSVSQSKDIIEAAGKWQWITKPDRSLFERKPMITYKLSTDGREALVLVLDNFNGEGVNEINLNIKGKSYPLKTFGTRTSVVRLKL